MNYSLHVEFQTEFRKYVEMAYQKYGYDASPTMEFSDRMRTTAGRAFLTKHQIKINRRLAVDNVERIKQTIGHEVAHLVAYKIYGETGHGRKWKMVMRSFGLEPERCHNMDVSNIVTNRTKVTCDCCGAELSIGPTRLKRLIAGTKYYHPKCGRAGTLTIVKG